MSEIKDGGPAFPYCVWVGDHHNGHNTGMSLRDYFAGMALQGLLANPSIIQKGQDLTGISFDYADAMLSAGKKDSPCQTTGVVGKSEDAK